MTSFLLLSFLFLFYVARHVVVFHFDVLVFSVESFCDIQPVNGTNLVGFPKGNINLAT